MNKNNKEISDNTIFQIAIALLPFENFFFAPSSGWATITPIIFVVYLLFNFKLLIKEVIKYKKIVILFMIAIAFSIINYIFVGVHIKNVINASISLGLGFVSLFSLDIYYNKNKESKNIVNIIIVSYVIAILIGVLQYITIKFNIKILYEFFDIIFKRNYLKYNRVQYFFTEPSFIGMHLFGILLPIYFIKKNKKILSLMVLFCATAFIFSSGVRILLDICVVSTILLFGYLIRNKKYKYILIIPLVGIIAISILYNTNYRIRRIAEQGIYADGSLASRYFRIQSSIYGYSKKPLNLLFGYGLGNSFIPLNEGYNDAIVSYKSDYRDEVNELSNVNLIEDSVSYCLYIRFISEFGLILCIVALIYLIKITKNSKFEYKYSYLLTILYLYLQFESYAFYAMWIFILIMLNTKNNKEEILAEKSLL